MNRRNETLPRSRFRLARLLGRCFPLLIGSAVLFPVLARAQISLTVRANDQETGAAMEQVRVEVVLFPDTVVVMGFTDGTGRLEFLNMIKQKYVLRATKLGYQSHEESLDLSSQVSSSIVSVRLRRADDKPDAPGGGVSVRVLSIPENARREFESGMALLGEKNDAKGSISRFRKAIDEYPDYHEAYYLLGMAQLKTGDATGGEASLRKSIELNPHFLDPYYPLADLLILMKKYAEAEELLQTPHQEDQASWKWPYELAMVYDKLGQWEKGIVFGLMALERKDAPSKVRLLMANLYENNGEIAKAIAELEAFKKQDPKSTMIPKVNQVLGELRKQIRGEESFTAG